MDADSAPAPKPIRDPQHANPAFYASCALGVIGLVFIVVGAVLGSRPVAIGGYLFGAGSLVAALTWRSQLIQAWRAAKTAAPPTMPAPPPPPAANGRANGQGQAPSSPRSS